MRREAELSSTYLHSRASHEYPTNSFASEADRRFGWNGRWTGGDHKGVGEKADLLNEHVANMNDKIAELE